MKKPIIGITLDSEESGNYSKFPWYAIRKNYLDSIFKYGGIPFPLFHKCQSINDLVQNIDSLIITGGNFDIHPNFYNQTLRGSRSIKNDRTKFEIKIFNYFLKQKKPILGICGGEQLINIACGGDLIQDIKINKKFKINHEQISPRNETSHSVFINKNTKLYEIINKNKIYVNSAHHQSVNKLGKNLITAAEADDEIIEAIEHTKHPWCIGVQWHPEFLITKYDKLLVAEFIRVSSN
tara:strand:- start:276 stop:986 length:711 start_codon:yes stop_codon:yes gene_type:complete